MNIAVDITPISGKKISEHKVRGVGMYIKFLVENLEKFDKENSYTFFTRGHVLPVNIDVIHYPYFDPFFQTLPFQKKYKTVVTVHDLTPIVFEKHFPAGIRGKLFWNIQKSLLGKVEQIITDSNNSKNDIVRIVGIPEEKVSVVYLAAGEEFRKLKIVPQEDLPLYGGGDWGLKIKKKYGLPDSFFLYVGDATWNKNLPRLVSVIKKIGLPLVMVGKALNTPGLDKKNAWNKDLVYVQNEIAGNSLFHLLGFLPANELVKLYNLAEALVMPSIYEGFGLPVLEAMRCGCPVIASRGGSLPEIGGDSVLYIDCLDEKNMADVMQKIFNDKKLQENLRKKGFLQAKKFTPEKTVSMTVEAYNKAVG